MEYCHRCGKVVKELENFCAECGAKLKEVVGDVEEDVGEVVKEVKSRKGLFIFILILIIIGYIVLDLWAVSQVSPEVSLGSVWTTISSLKGNIGLSSASASTEFRINNPTFVPVFLFPIKYKVLSGSTEIAEGKTGMIFIAPHSSNYISANIELSYSGVGVAIFNELLGNQEDLHIDFYSLGIKLTSIE